MGYGAFSSPSAAPGNSHHGCAPPSATSASYGVSTGFWKSSPQSMDKRGHAICANASAPFSIAIFAGVISEMRNTAYAFPHSRNRLSRCSRIAGLPCLPSVPSTTPHRSARDARATIDLRTERISPCAYSSSVSARRYGSYLNAGTVGFAIMIASRWKRPSATNTIAEGRDPFSPSSPPADGRRVGAVHPSTSPGLSGLLCGTASLGNRSDSRARTS